MKIVVLNENGKEVAEIKNCKTLKGAYRKMLKSSIAFHSNWTVAIIAGAQELYDKYKII